MTLRHAHTYTAKEQEGPNLTTSVEFQQVLQLVITRGKEHILTDNSKWGRISSFMCQSSRCTDTQTSAEKHIQFSLHVWTTNYWHFTVELPLCVFVQVNSFYKFFTAVYAIRATDLGGKWENLTSFWWNILQSEFDFKGELEFCYSWLRISRSSGVHMTSSTHSADNCSHSIYVLFCMWGWLTKAFVDFQQFEVSVNPTWPVQLQWFCNHCIHISQQNANFLQSICGVCAWILS